ncbi:DUF1566 domain-containing protein [Photobacterium galatheae]|uniref:Lcl C-terminal domain-containing protein n=1 Tax=Photobacterium galatheae TaxID=1654360 RepID=A0A066RUD9_9GAMM|nr:DUF1566 domain-containing protein [Photobacterium galatheae]KDM92686.1 hypothetical protein EA58_04770 [Photobacterium galatheae]MCM0149396.1 DUF1566 domain-containing protein [Photobacterium galatheae]
MKSIQLAVLPVALTVVLSGCNGSDSNSSDQSQPVYEISGRVSSATVDVPMTVCADINRDWTCSADEPSVKATQYNFTLTSTDIRVKTSPLLVQAAPVVAARSTAPAALNLAAPAARENAFTLVNGVTTLVVGEMMSGASLNTAVVSVTQNLEALGITPPSNLLVNSDDAALAALDSKLLSHFSQLSARSTDYGVVVAGVAKGLNVYGADLLADSLAEEKLQKILSLGQMAVRQLNDTGMVQHLNLSTGALSNQPDPGAPDQDASFGLDVTDGGFQLTKLDAKGQALPENSKTWQCVKDERTGLIWEIKLDDPSAFRDKHRLFALETDTIKPHADEIALASCRSDHLAACTTQEYSQKLNELAYCGKTNWRLPTMHEQYDLLDFSETATDAKGNVYGLTVKFFNDLWIGSDDLPYGYYWSSTFLRTDPNYTEGRAISHLTQMTQAGGGTGLGELTAYYAPCVAGEECLSPNVMAVRMVAK